MLRTPGGVMMYYRQSHWQAVSECVSLGDVEGCDITTASPPPFSPPELLTPGPPGPLLTGPPPWLH